MPDSPNKTAEKEIGYVISTQDYLINLEGLPSARVNDIILTKSNGRALITALEGKKVEAVMLDRERPRPGDYLVLSDSGLAIPLGSNIYGRAINPLGVPLDGKAGLPPGGERIDLDIVAPGIDGREAITEQFYTGITMVDTLLPIGRGQRELVLCEPRSGKEQFFLDVIVSQKTQNRVCIYAAIGRSEVEVKRFTEDIEKFGASPYTIIIAATSDESAPMITLTPSIASAFAEYYRNQGRHVLLILDDLATHAKYSREISLLAGRVPGRESYPADIFYQHSSMLERGGNFNEHFSKGSITLLPTIETNIENFTNLIPTNVMSITDGHILFSAALRAQGIYPAIESERSVTRVGRQTQFFIHKVLSDKIRLLLAEYHELERYGRFGSELSGETQQKIKRGKICELLIQQEPLTYMSFPLQILMLSLVFTGFYDKKELAQMKTLKTKLTKILSEVSPFKELGAEIGKSSKFDELVTKLKTQNEVLEAACQRLGN